MQRHSRMKRAVVGLAVVSLGAVGLVACGDDGEETADTTTTSIPADVSISDVWARPVEDLAAKDTSAIYMKINAGEGGDELISASVPSDVAGTVELHETTMADETEMDADMTETTMGDDMGDDMDHSSGMMTMRQVEMIEVPANGSVELKPGGFHVMLLDMQKTLAVGDTVEVTLTFANAGEVVTTAEVREP
jgi:copper(I)-binding protein